MNQDQQFRIQAYLDGELSAREAKEVSELIAKDSDAQLLFDALQMMKNALVDNEPELKCPESREFFWSRIEREIRVQESQAERAPAPSLSFFGWLQRYLMPVGAAAAVALLAVVATNKSASFESASIETLNEEM